MIRIIYLIVFIFCIENLNSQNGPNSPRCDLKYYGDFSLLQDSIDYRVNCYSKIDFNNTTCASIISEGYHNIVPHHESNLMYVFYFENEIKYDEIDLIKLFDDSNYREKYISRIQMMFVYDVNNSFTQTFKAKEEINQLLNCKIRKGLLNQLLQKKWYYEGDSLHPQNTKTYAFFSEKLRIENPSNKYLNYSNYWEFAKGKQFKYTYSIPSGDGVKDGVYVLSNNSIPSWKYEDRILTIMNNEFIIDVLTPKYLLIRRKED